MQYGTEEQTSILDSNGSTVDTIRNYKRGEVVKPIRRRFNIRQKVVTREDELKAYEEFSATLDAFKKDPEFKVDKGPLNKGEAFYYVIKCWTTVEY